MSFVLKELSNWFSVSLSFSAINQLPFASLFSKKSQLLTFFKGRKLAGNVLVTFSLFAHCCCSPTKNLPYFKVSRVKRVAAHIMKKRHHFSGLFVFAFVSPYLWIEAHQKYLTHDTGVRDGPLKNLRRWQSHFSSTDKVSQPALRVGEIRRELQDCGWGAIFSSSPNQNLHLRSWAGQIAIINEKCQKIDDDSRMMTAVLKRKKKRHRLTAVSHLVKLLDSGRSLKNGSETL